MTKKVICLLCVALFLLPACSSDNVLCENENYRIFRESGKTYMEFLKDFSASPYHSVPEFDSFENIQPLILSGGLSSSDLKYLQGKSVDNVLEIYDLDALHNLRTPDDMRLVKAYWEGDAYTIRTVSVNWDSSGIFHFVTQESYQKSYEYYYATKSSKTERIALEEHDPERNARIIHYLVDSESVTTSKEIRYRLETSHGFTDVLEVYLVGSYDISDVPPRSDAFPSFVYLFGKDNDVFFWGYLAFQEKRPTVEWLSQFGVIPVE